MPFLLKKFNAIKGQKIQLFLLKEAELSLSLSQKLLSKNRVFDDQGNILKNGQTLQCEYVQVAVFEGHTRGLKPVFEVQDFAVFDKPSGLMVHPTRKTTAYSLLDEIRYHFGNEADLAHRIDAETSGLVLVTKNKHASTILKTMFENRKYNKEYLALVKGQLKNNITINSPISKSNSTIAVRMTCEHQKGKDSMTHIHPLEFNEKDNTTLVKAMPITGRQHQIRVHLDSIGHTILGDPIYGVNDQIADECLRKTLSDERRIEFTGAKRLMLHANNLSFTYKEVEYDIVSELGESVFNQF
jgi:23S rRNA pseudouridine1911/1915/1917 synthase